MKKILLFISLQIVLFGCTTHNKSIQGTWNVVECIPKTEATSPLGEGLMLWLAHSLVNTHILIDEATWVIQDSVEYNYHIKDDTLFLKIDDEEESFSIDWSKDTLLLTNKDVTFHLLRQ